MNILPYSTNIHITTNINEEYFSFTDSHDQLVPLMLIVYKFDGVQEHPVLVHPHGNAKTNKPYVTG